MDKKDLFIGILAIVTVGLAGGLGYVIIVNPLSGEPSTPVLNQGLPEDWSTAPNSSTFTLYDVHGVEHIISLGEILEGVQIYLDDLAANSLSDWKNYYELTTIQDPISGQYVTGVNILDILEEKGINFAGDLEFTTEDSVTREVHTADIIAKSYAKSKTYYVLVLAINQEWLQDSPYYAFMGNFSIMGLDPNDNFYNFNQVSVMNNWTIDLIVNDVTEFSLDAWDLIQDPYTAVYQYESTSGWGANRQYWGKNISEIIAMTTAGAQIDYEVTFRAADGFVTPFWKWEPPYNKSEVENGMYSNETHVIPRSDDDYVNGTDTSLGVPIPATNLIMNLAWKLQEFGETYDGIADEVWSVPKILSYSSGPFNVQVPGRNRANYAKWVTEIIIDY